MSSFRNHAEEIDRAVAEHKANLERATKAALKHMGVHEKTPDCTRTCLHPRRKAE